MATLVPAPEVEDICMLVWGKKVGNIKTIDLPIGNYISESLNFDNVHFSWDNWVIIHS